MRKGIIQIRQGGPGNYTRYSREEWRFSDKGGRCSPVSARKSKKFFTEEEVNGFHGQIETVSSDEIDDAYLPLAELLRHHYLASPEQRPFVVGITGSVSVGKSTASRVLKALMEKLEPPLRVQIVTTDHFLYPNSVLETKKLMDRKGFPETFDKAAIITFLTQLRTGASHLEIPVYSHQSYDIVAEATQIIGSSDVVILEGVNILHRELGEASISDFTNFNIFIEADTGAIKDWFVKRFLVFIEQARKDPSDFYHRFSKMNKQEAVEFASYIWATINELNLNESILPFKWSADLIFNKRIDHRMKEVLLRKG